MRRCGAATAALAGSAAAMEAIARWAAGTRLLAAGQL